MQLSMSAFSISVGVGGFTLFTNSTVVASIIGRVACHGHVSRRIQDCWRGTVIGFSYSATTPSHDNVATGITVRPDLGIEPFVLVLSSNRVIQSWRESAVTTRHLTSSPRGSIVAEIGEFKSRISDFQTTLGSSRRTYQYKA